VNRPAPLLLASALSALAGSLIGSSVTPYLERAPRGSASAASQPLPAAPSPRFEQIAACYSREIEALRADLRTLLREELAQEGRLAPVTPDAGSAPSEPAPPSAEALDAEQQANGIVETALARRTWTSEDALALRLLLGQVTAAQREDLLRTLVPAMNDGRVKNLASGAPF
jgi:hypothetical protein